MNLLYILDDEKKPVALNRNSRGYSLWAQFFRNHMNRIVGHDIIDGIEISTVFLGIDYSSNGDPPILFETAIFQDREIISIERYSNWNEAVEGHARWFDKINKK